MRRSLHRHSSGCQKRCHSLARIAVWTLIVFPIRRYKDGGSVARHPPDPRLRNRRYKDGGSVARHPPDPRPLVDSRSGRTREPDRSHLSVLVIECV